MALEFGANHARFVRFTLRTRPFDDCYAPASWRGRKRGRYPIYEGQGEGGVGEAQPQGPLSEVYNEQEAGAVAIAVSLAEDNAQHGASSTALPDEIRNRLEEHGRQLEEARQQGRQEGRAAAEEEMRSSVLHAMECFVCHDAPALVIVCDGGHGMCMPCTSHMSTVPGTGRCPVCRVTLSAVFRNCVVAMHMAREVGACSGDATVA